MHVWCLSQVQTLLVRAQYHLHGHAAPWTMASPLMLAVRITNDTAMNRNSIAANTDAHLGAVRACAAAWAC